MSRIFSFCIDSIFVFTIDFCFQGSNGDVLSIFLGVCQLMCLGALVMMPAPPSSSRNCHIDNCYFIHLFFFIPILIMSKDTTVHCGLWWPCMLIGFCKFIDRDVLRKKNTRWFHGRNMLVLPLYTFVTPSKKIQGQHRIKFLFRHGPRFSLPVTHHVYHR